MLANLASLFGIPLAIIIFVNEKEKERRDREYGTYDALDNKWLEFLQLCIQNPELDLHLELPLERRIKLSSNDKIRQYAMFEILIALLERSFLMYRDQSNSIKKAQWKGWSEYMHAWVKRDTFRRLWVILMTKQYYDMEFMSYMNNLLLKTSSENTGVERVG
jgi:hypothetical protein